MQENLVADIIQILKSKYNGKLNFEEQKVDLFVTMNCDLEKIISINTNSITYKNYGTFNLYNVDTYHLLYVYYTLNDKDFTPIKYKYGKYFPVILKKWFKLFKEVKITSKITILAISLMAVIGILALCIGNPYFAIAPLSVISLYEISKRYEL